MFLLTAEFKRHGHDLHLTGKDVSGKSEGTVVLDGYFAAPQLADLATAKGAVIAGETVKLLAGPLAPAQYAQAGAGVAGAQAIGKITASDGGVRVIHANGLEEAGAVNTPIFLNDVLVTAANSSVGISFVDKTNFALGGNARMTIDKFVYGPGVENGALFNVVQGAFSFISGAVAKTAPDAMKVQLPTLTIGIRGTKAAGFAATVGEQSQVTLLRNDDGTIGEIFVSNIASAFTIATANFTAFSSSMDRAFQSPALLVNLSKYQDALATLARTSAADRTQLEQSPAEQALERLAQIQPGAGGGQGSGSGGAQIFHFADLGVTAVVFEVDGQLLVAIIPGDIDGSGDGDDETNTPNNQNPTIADSDATTDEDNPVSGKVNGSDGDGDTLTYSVVTGPILGSVALSSGGNFTYTPGALMQTLAVGEAAVDKFTVIALDGRGGKATKDIFVTINGLNDAPISFGVPDLGGAAQEIADNIAGENATTHTDSGVIGFFDIDLSDTHTVAFVLKSSDAAPNQPGYVDGAPGTGRGTFSVVLTDDSTNDFTHAGAVTWNFSVEDSALDDLAVNQTLTQVYTVTVSDGHGAVAVSAGEVGLYAVDVTVVMTGVNDTPEIVSAAANHSGAVTEDAATPDLAVTKTITFRDVDLIDTHTRSFALKSAAVTPDLPGYAEGAPPGTPTLLGTFSLSAITEDPADTTNTGTLDWTFTVANSAVQHLAKDQVVTQVYTVTVTDNNGALITVDVTVTITGVNDTATVTSLAADHAGAVTEDTSVNGGGNVVATDTITFSDIDLIDTHTVSAVLASSDAVANLPGFDDTAPGFDSIGTFALSAVTEDNTNTDPNGSFTWTYTLANSNATLQSLAEGQTITQIYTVSIKDNSGAGNDTRTQDVAITINGKNDTATIVSGSTDDAGAVTEDAATPNLTDSGTITFQDVDLIDTHTATFTLKSTSATPDLPGYNEGAPPGTPTLLGTFSIDAAVTENTTDTTNTGTLGWSFTVANSAVQHLAKDQVITQVYTVKIKDNNNAEVTRDVTVTLTGVNDTPDAVNDTHASTLIEGDESSNGNASIDGNIQASGSVLTNDTDVDAIDTRSVAGVAAGNVGGPLSSGTGATITGIYGTVVIAADGSYTYTLDNSDPDTQALSTGDSVTEVFTYTIADNNGAKDTATLSINIDGRDDTYVGTAGADTITGTGGRDTIQGLGDNDTLNGAGGNDLIQGGDNDDLLNGGAGSDTLQGGSGIDTATYGGSAAGVTVDLTVTTGQTSGGEASGDILSGIENLTGSSSADTLTGDGAANVLDGGGGADVLNGAGGADTLRGGAGADSLDGGGGTDTADYSTSGSAVTVSLTSNTGTGGDAEGDTLANIENLTGSGQADVLTGDGAANLLDGAGGDDTLSGLGGADSLVGGGGNDTADYSASGAGVTVDLGAGTGAGGDAQGDTLATIENVNGSASADVLTGDGNVNVLTGGDGNDTLSGAGGADTLLGGNNDDLLLGGAGADVLTGGSGTDTASYSGSAGVTVDLTVTTGQTSGGDASGDVLSGIENLLGSSNADVLTGDGAANKLDGSGGDDTLTGAGGADSLVGGAGLDTLNGDAGSDTLEGGTDDDKLAGGADNDLLVGGAGVDSLTGDAGTDTADYSASGSGVTVNLTTGAGAGGDAQGDTLATVENVTGSSSADTLTGDGNANLLDGAGGDDTLAGLGGSDSLVGGSGNDTADYSASSAGVTVDLSSAGAQSGGDAAGDVLSGIENAIGSTSADVLTGTTGANALTGGAGNDTLTGGAGADKLLGGNDNDTLVFNTGDAASGETIDGGAGSDTLIVTTSTDFSTAVLIGIEKVDIANDQTVTFAGDQIGGQSWNIDPSGGVQTLVVNVGPSGNDVDLSALTFTGWDPAGEGDSVVVNGNANANTIVGTSQVDTVNGVDGNDTLSGGGANDKLTGGAGNDVLIGGAGSDSLTGGADTDTADYSASGAGVTVDLTVTTGQTSGGDASGDTLSGIENVTGSGSTDALTGDANANLLSGGAGNDLLKGGAGADSLVGGADTDTA
ncbi:MAG: VCBS domain-containing protein, partial [Rhodospirillales bacterium]